MSGEGSVKIPQCRQSLIKFRELRFQQIAHPPAFTGPAFAP
jgi:hypothetical protein